MSDISFKDRVVIVTGAGGGLGKSYALEMAKRGGAVVVNDLGGSVDGPGGSSKMVDAVVEEILVAGGRAIANYDSVATWAGAQRIAAAAIKAFGRIDALINNAGNMRYKPFEECSADDLNALLSVHLMGTFNMAKAVWPHMKAQGYGRIVSTSSSAGMYGDENYSCYGAAKAGVTGLMNVLAHEGEAHGILCNVMMPNAMTRMTDMVSAQMGAEDVDRSRAMMAAVQNSMSPDFNAGLVVYLASSACSTTHMVYSSCGGRMARVLIGATDGWQGSKEIPAAAEDIAAHFDEITDLARGVHTPKSPGDEWRIVLSKADPVIPAGKASL